MHRPLLTRLRSTRPGRPSGLPRRRLGLAGGLVAGGLVLGGLAEVLLAMTAAVLALDALVPMPGGTRTAADDRFRHLVRERRRARLAARLRGGPERLDLLDDRAGGAATAPRRALGIQAIDVDSVTGTVEPLKARTFDRALRPDPVSREQWKRIWMAHAGGAPLPPVSVYRVGGEHVLRDGHHRVSVARALGLERIDAAIVELHRPPRC